ncbi:MAG TPA: hypothetical protein ENG42_00825 [Candidatus Aenigmarchaeota archaeon]|nr:hypothetical protein [Candidatus Aenigmarchaeota archaeon]
MRDVIKHDGAWVIAGDELDEEDIRRLMLNCDVCISDLDDTDANSPAKYLACNKLFHDEPLSSCFIKWCIHTGFELMKKGKRCELDRWKEYVRLFLNTEKEREKARRLFTPEIVNKLIYPGVKDFYRLIKGRKIYVTGNIGEIAEVFAKYTGVDEIKPEVYDKARVMEELLRDAGFKRITFKGDSNADEEALDVLRFYEKRGEVEYVIACDVACSIKQGEDHIMNKGYDIAIGRDYRGLVRVLKG